MLPPGVPRKNRNHRKHGPKEEILISSWLWVNCFILFKTLDLCHKTIKSLTEDVKR